eukprot:scaffold25542_cov60-Cyclotella_meneghiniana.AAC.9
MEKCVGPFFLAISAHRYGRRADCAPKWRPRTPDLPHYGSGVRLGLALVHVNGRAIYSTYLTYDVIHTCTFYEFLRI